MRWKISCFPSNDWSSMLWLKTKLMFVNLSLGMQADKIWNKSSNSALEISLINMLIRMKMNPHKYILLVLCRLSFLRLYEMYVKCNAEELSKLDSEKPFCLFNGKSLFVQDIVQIEYSYTFCYQSTDDEQSITNSYFYFSIRIRP